MTFLLPSLSVTLSRDKTLDRLSDYLVCNIEQTHWVLFPKCTNAVKSAAVVVSKHTPPLSSSPPPSSSSSLAHRLSPPTHYHHPCPPATTTPAHPLSPPTHSHHSPPTTSSRHNHYHLPPPQPETPPLPPPPPTHYYLQQHHHHRQASSNSSHVRAVADGQSRAVVSTKRQCNRSDRPACQPLVGHFSQQSRTPRPGFTCVFLVHTGLSRLFLRSATTTTCCTVAVIAPRAFAGVCTLLFTER